MSWPETVQEFVARMPLDWLTALTPQARDTVQAGLTTALLKIQATVASGKAVYPPPQDVFRALELTPFDRVRVVIVGQDPYISVGQAHGLAFSVQNQKIPPSLDGILAAVQRDTGQPSRCATGNLEAWAAQGVLLLNTALTVTACASNSHVSHDGWGAVTRELLRALMARADRRLIFLAWGRVAQQAVKAATPAGGTHHAVLQASHPSPLGRMSAAPVPFVTCRHFTTCNELLQTDPIMW